MTDDLETPSGNTGLNCQTLNKGLTVKVDTISGTCRRVESVADAVQIINLLERQFNEVIEFHPDRAITIGKRWDGSGHGARGTQIGWQKPTDEEPGALYIYLGGQVLAQTTSRDAHDLTCYLGAGYGFVATRFDSAIDDYDKRLSMDALWDAIEAGNVARFDPDKAVQISHRGNRGKTVYMGSAQSDKRVRFYDKTEESNGEVDAYRLEVQLRGKRAAEACAMWCEIWPENYDELGPQFLASLVTGAVHFCDRSSGDAHLERCPVLDWWQEFLDLTAQGLKIAVTKAKPILERKLTWLDKQVAQSLAVVKRVLKDEFHTYWNALIGGGENRLGPRHRALVAAAVMEGW